MKTIAVIPCYNEQKRIVAVMQTVQKQVDHIVIVDDGSKDLSVETIREHITTKVTLLRHLINAGKGATVRTGCDFAINTLKADLLVLMDGDGQHDAEDIPKLLAKQKATRAQMVFGRRKRSTNMPLVPRLGNWGLSFLCNFLFGVRIDDTQSGFRVLTRQAYRLIRWSSSDYSMESEMIALMGQHKLTFDQQDVKTIYLDAYKGTTIFDGIIIACNLIKWKVLTW